MIHIATSRSLPPTLIRIKLIPARHGAKLRLGIPRHKHLAAMLTYPQRPVRVSQIEAVNGFYRRFQGRKNVAKIHALSRENVTTLQKDDFTKMLAADAAEQVLQISIRVEKLRTEMIKLAKQTPEVPTVIEHYGVGETLASKLIVETQDLRRFIDKWVFVAYAGVDPGKDDSGKKITKSGKISWTGDALLRKTAYQVVGCNLLHSPADEPVYQLRDKKCLEGKNYHVYMTAACNKFLRIYYARVSEYLNSLESDTFAYISDDAIFCDGINFSQTAENNNAFTCKQDSTTQECNMSGLQGLAYTNGAVSAVPRDRKNGKRQTGSFQLWLNQVVKRWYDKCGGGL